MIARALLAVAVVASACDGDAARDSQLIARAPVPGHASPDAQVVATLDGADTPDTIDGADAPDTSSVETLDTAAADTAAADIPAADTAAADTADTTDTADAADTTDTTAPQGTPADPIVVSAFPFVTADDTRAAPSSSLDRYTCAAADESGPERVYRFDLAQGGSFVAEVAEANGVDVDLQLLDADPASASDPSAVPCRARDNTRLTADLPPGRYWLVVDTYVAAAGPKPGAYRLALELTVMDAWQTVRVAPGITWRHKAYASYAGGRQTADVLDVDLADPTVSIRPYRGDGCSRPSAVGSAEGAIAAINAGFFDTGPGTCPPLDLIKIDGVLVDENHLTGQPQRSFGVDPSGAPLMEWVAANVDWPDAWSAIGSYPSLVTDGAVLVEPDKDSDFFDGPNPRTALGLTASGHLLLVTVAGRGPHGLGMSIAQLAQYLVDLGAAQAVNLDGGGSTAMWIAGQSLSGIVGFPSDGDGVTHGGERAVSDLLLVFSHPSHP